MCIEGCFPTVSQLYKLRFLEDKLLKVARNGQNQIVQIQWRTCRKLWVSCFCCVVGKEGEGSWSRSLRSKGGCQAPVKMGAADVSIWAELPKAYVKLTTSSSSAVFFPKPRFGPWVDAWLRKKTGRSCLLIKLRSDNRSLTGRNASLGTHWFAACDLPW